MVNETEKETAFFADDTRKKYLLGLYNSYREEAGGALLIPYVYNYFAYLLHQFGEYQTAKEVMKKVSGQMTFYPWAYLGITNNAQLQALYQ